MKSFIDSDWGDSRDSYRRQIVSSNNIPFLKVRFNEIFNRLKIFQIHCKVPFGIGYAIDFQRLNLEWSNSCKNIVLRAFMDVFYNKKNPFMKIIPRIIEMMETWNKNMDFFVVSSRWGNCLGESVSQWTNGYNCSCCVCPHIENDDHYIISTTLHLVFRVFSCGQKKLLRKRIIVTN